jgi:hypothetical protein
VSLPKSDFAGDGFRLQNLRDGEASGEERALRTLALVAAEVELICNAVILLISYVPACRNPQAGAFHF